MGIVLGIVGGCFAALFLGKSTKALLSGDIARFSLFFTLNILAIGAALLICAFVWPKQIAWSGASLAAMVVGIAIVQFLLSRRKK